MCTIQTADTLPSTKHLRPSGRDEGTWADDSSLLVRLRRFPATLSAEELLALLFSDPSRSLEEELALSARLLKNSRHLGDLLQVDFDYLCCHQELGLERAMKLRVALELARRMGMPQRYQQVCIQQPEDAAALFISQLRYLPREQMRVLLLNEQNEVLDNIHLYDGTLDTIATRVAEIYQPALLRGCSRIVLGHLHPSGSLECSEVDLSTTRKLIEAGDLLDVQLLDHLLVTHEGFVSLRAELQAREMLVAEQARMPVGRFARLRSCFSRLLRLIFRIVFVP